MNHGSVRLYPSGRPPLPCQCPSHADQVPAQSIAMKKTLKPFAVEVRRSRLTSQQAPTITRSAVLTTIAPSPTPPGQNAGKDVAPSPSPKRRILPDLSVKAPLAERPASPMTGPEDPAPAIMPLMKALPGAEPPAPATGDDTHSPLPGSLACGEQMQSSRARRTRLSKDLPRGQRWKRRLPPVAW